jgi:hypothetical protein
MLNLYKCLKTIDLIIEKLLLKEYNDEKKDINFSIKTLYDNKYIISIKELLTDKECDEIIDNSKSYGFSDINSYSKEERDAKRVCVIDGKLSNSIWNKLEKNDLINYLNNLELRPYGFNTEGTWKPFKINECNRISNYSPESK